MTTPIKIYQNDTVVYRPGGERYRVLDVYDRGVLKQPRASLVKVDETREIRTQVPLHELILEQSGLPEMPQVSLE